MRPAGDDNAAHGPGSAKELDHSRGFSSYNVDDFNGGEHHNEFNNKDRRGLGTRSDLDMPSHADEVDD
jgi:hypothetical protein